MDASLQAFIANFKGLPPWVLHYGFPLSLILFLAVQRFVIRRIQKQITFFSSERLKILAGLKNPLTILILAVFIRLAGLVYKISGDWKDFFVLTPKILIFLAVAQTIKHALLTLITRVTKHNHSLSIYEAMLSVLVNVAIYSMLLIVVLDLFGISVTPLVASLGIGSAAVALALQKTLSDFISGLHLIMDKPISVGHFVRLDSGEEGLVEQIGWRNSRIRTMANNTVVMPNSKLADTTLVNFNMPEKELAVPVEVSVAYESNLEHVEKITLEVAEQTLTTHAHLTSSFKPLLRFHTFGDSGIGFTVVLRAREYGDQYIIKSQFIKSLHKRYEQEGIIIPYPQRVVWSKTTS
ncbi:mechanosensitive ion channel family protein [bacterium]|nr:mechanosensitive ion channel family protein [bacterium]